MTAGMVGADPLILRSLVGRSDGVTKGLDGVRVLVDTADI